MRWIDGAWVVQVRYRPGASWRAAHRRRAVLVRDGLEGGRLNAG